MQLATLLLQLAHTQARPSLEKKQDAKNEDPNSPTPQKVKNEQQNT